MKSHIVICIALKPEGDEKWKPGILWIVIIFAWRLLEIFEKCTENENSQIFIFTVFTIFFSSKAWNLPKTLKILFYVLYDITYITHRERQQLFELAYKLKYYALLFWSVYMYMCRLVDGWLFWGFTSLKRSFSHIATWKQEITNLNRSGETGNQTPVLLLRKPRSYPLHHRCSDICIGVVWLIVTGV